MEVLDLGFTRLEFRPGYVIACTVEGADIDVDHHKRVIDEIEKRVDGDYGIILDEKNSYSVRLGTMVEIRNNPRLRCMAAIAYRTSTRMVANVTGAAMGKPFNIFSTSEEACAWMEAQLAV